MMEPVLLELAGAVLEATVLLGVALLLVTTVLRRSSAAWRHLVWALALGGALLAPLLGIALPWRWEVAALPTPAVSAAAAVPGERSPVGAPAALTTEDGAMTTADARRGAVDAAPAPRPAVSPLAAGWLPTALIAVWLTGAAMVLLRLAWGFRTLARIRRRARPLADPAWDREAAGAAPSVGVRPVPLLESDEIEAPLAVGLGRPAILLPHGAHEWSAERARAVLLHELAHVRRWDVATHLLGRVACALYWFHPLAWHAARRLRNESERACDDMALGAGAVPSRYVADLLEIARGSLGHAARNPALAMARPSEFEGRLLAILDPTGARWPVRPATAVAAVAVALAAAVGLAGMAVIPAQAAPVSVQSGNPAQLSAGLDATAPASVAQAGPDVAANLIALLRDPAPRVRAAAASALGDRRVASAMPELTRALRDASPRVRERAAYAIGRLEAAAPVSELVRLLEADPERDVQVAAVWALGESGSLEAVHALAAAVRERDDEGLRERIVDALGETGQPAALPVLEGLLVERDRTLRAAALDAVAEIGTPAAEAVLVRAMQHPDARLRSMAADALGGRR